MSDVSQNESLMEENLGNISSNALTSVVDGIKTGAFRSMASALSEPEAKMETGSKLKVKKL